MQRGQETHYGISGESFTRRYGPNWKQLLPEFPPYGPFHTGKIVAARDAFRIGKPYAVNIPVSARTAYV